ncbi:hypothetical protein DsansV1_C35g0229391 [Dioscorea sansibarensis]
MAEKKMTPLFLSVLFLAITSCMLVQASFPPYPRWKSHPYPPSMNNRLPELSTARVSLPSVLHHRFAMPPLGFSFAAPDPRYTFGAPSPATEDPNTDPCKVKSGSGCRL